MSSAWILAAVLGLPLFAGASLALVGARRFAPDLNAAFSLLTLAAALWLAQRTLTQGASFAFGHAFHVDSFNAFLVALTALVGWTTALFSKPYMRVERERGRMSANRTRLYHAMYQLFVFAMLLALLTNNMGVLWVAMEAATLAAVLLVAVYRTAASLDAAWKYFILCGVGIAQALFGTILLYLAASRVLGGDDALLLTSLNAAKASLDPAIVSLAFVFLLIGYGTKVGLVPMHNWLPDAHAEGPTPISAVLSGLLLNVALYAVLRCKVLADGALQNGLPGHLLAGFGLVSVLLATFSLFRQTDAKRLFSFSSIEHMGMMTFAFGLGGPVATFAGLLHMSAHALIKSAIFFSVGHAAQKTGTQAIVGIRGLVRTSPVVGWGMVLGTLAILGMPPFGVFASEFLILTTALQTLPWTVPLLMLALVVAFAVIFRRMQGMAFGESTARRLEYRPALLPVFIHLGIGLMLGLYIPSWLAAWYRAAGAVLAG
ncbi:Hydrogenase-4 component B [Paraburkholderia caffeinitolerans]|uniref:Hydrogenase-4 component B n=1 Tax=Paraburkholderia caffeinitolerans TaxID=1723730 RepID=A0A6J5FI83_9BURK|nr:MULTISPECIES: hydrogenase 4 subunit F [Paraburkholderia]CAB3778108.1 Hydrogenase-4 component B [Paraburkholderia caffeinitolerans]